MGDFLNLKDAFYEGVGEYGVPELVSAYSHLVFGTKPPKKG